MTGDSTGPSRRRRVVLGVLVVVVGLGAVFTVATARLFLWPPTDPPAKVDAIVALGGDPGQLRAKQAITLAEQGYAPVVLVSLGGYPPAPCPTATRVHVHCFRADPLNTRGEVEYATSMAVAHHWTSLMLVPERSQATRARLLFRRCGGMHLVVVPVADHGTHLLFDIAYEWAALAKAFLVHTSC